MIIVANWKAYIEDAAQAKKLFAAAKRATRLSTHTIVIAPPAPLLGMLAAGSRSRVSFCIQNIAATAGGAATGAITAQIAAAAGAAYALVGHSERRSAGETNQIVADKLSRALSFGLTPILCVGEHVRDGEGKYLGFVREEITSALLPLPPKERSRVIVAYEPLWAIGKSAELAAKPNDLAEMTLYIRKVLSELLPGKGSAATTVLYGGSVETANIRDLAASSGIDGFLIGHASVNPHTFLELVKELS